MPLRFNRAAAKAKLPPKKQTRRIRCNVEIDIPDTISDEDAIRLLQASWILDCWVGEVVVEEIVEVTVRR